MARAARERTLRTHTHAHAHSPTTTIDHARQNCSRQQKLAVCIDHFVALPSATWTSHSRQGRSTDCPQRRHHVDLSTTSTDESFPSKLGLQNATNTRAHTRYEQSAARATTAARHRQATKTRSLRRPLCHSAVCHLDVPQPSKSLGLLSATSPSRLPQNSVDGPLFAVVIRSQKRPKIALNNCH